MDTSFRDGFQSVYGARVFVDDFLPALQAAVNAGIRHFEVAGGARFQSPIFIVMRMLLKQWTKSERLSDLILICKVWQEALTL